MKEKSNIDTFGMIPPQATDIEEAVIGALMLEQDAFCRVESVLSPESFYKEEHAIIYQVIKEMAKDGKSIDLMMVTRELYNRKYLEKIGGPTYITQLTNKVASAAHIEAHARIIAQTYMSREIIRLTTSYCSKAYDSNLDVEVILSGLQNEILALLENGVSNETNFNHALNNIRLRISDNRENPRAAGVKTGFHKYDNFTGGLQKTDLVIVAGETSQGKTSLALSILANAILLNENVRAAVYSLEMSKEKLVSRLLSTRTNIPAKDILSKPLSDYQIEVFDSIAKQLSNFPVWFDERSRQDIDSICSSIRKMKMKYDVNLIVVDFIQLVNTNNQKGKTDESMIAYITRSLKNVAKELDIIIIALSQLSRDKANPKPAINRLRGSGQIEEAADIILLVWRPEEYGIKEFPGPFEGILTNGLAEVIISKGRDVGTGRFLLRFNKETTGFFDYDPEMEKRYQTYDPNQTIESENRQNNNPF